MALSSAADRSVRAQGAKLRALMAVTALLLVGMGQAATFTVTKTADTNDGNCNADCSLREAIVAANASGGSDTIQFAIPLTDPGYTAGTGAFTITLSSPLPLLSDPGTTIDGRTQATNIGNTNSGTWVHPVYGTDRSVGTGPDGIEGTGDEATLPVYENPEIEIDGNDQGSIFEVTANDTSIAGLALYNNSALPFATSGILATAGTGLTVESNFLGLRADGSDPGTGQELRHGVRVEGGSATLRNNVAAYSVLMGINVRTTALIEYNDVYGIPASDGISVERSTGQTVTVRRNRTDSVGNFGIESYLATGPYTISENTVSRSGLTGVSEIGGVRVYGAGSTVSNNIIHSSFGAGLVLTQTDAPGSNQQNLISQNSIYNNGSLGIDLDVTNIAAGTNPNGDGVTPNDGSLDTSLPNAEMDYPVLSRASLLGSTLTVEGYVGSVALQLAGPHTLEFFKADDDGNNDGEIEAGDGLNVGHGEGRWYIDSCTSAASGFFSCSLSVPAAVSVSLGDELTATARDPSSNTSEFAANRTITEMLVIRKRAFQLDGTPIASGATLPAGFVFKFVLYINNRSGAVADVSLQDVLDPLFGFKAGTLQVDNSVTACAAQTCTAVEEAAIFVAVTAAPTLTDIIDGDVGSFTASTVDVGDQNVGNARLDIAASRVLAVAFSAQIQ